MIISHNILANNAQRQFGKVSQSQAKTAQKLSSGYRINRASDDAAGLSMSEKMRTQIRGLNKGTENTQQGMSLCQVADGALAEVNKMLHRITELSVQAANATLTPSDRDAIQHEISQILLEIDRIGNTTEFNTIPVFQGSEQIVSSADGPAISEGDIPFEDFTIADINLGEQPFQSGSSPNHLALQAIVGNPDSAAYGNTYNFIFGNGSTSNTFLCVDFPDGSELSCNLSDFSIQNCNYDAATNVWSRDFVLSRPEQGLELLVKQNITTDTSNPVEKKYTLTYDLQALPGGRTDVGVELFIHEDTAYNNNDRCEGYFMNGNRVETTGIYQSEPTGMDYLPGWGDSTLPTVPDSFSIINVDSALSFAEKISFENGSRPSALIIGQYNEIKSALQLESCNFSGKPTANMDLGFTLYYQADDLNTNQAFTYHYGIIATDSDINLNNVPLTPSNSAVTRHLPSRTFWIQSGDRKDNGLFLSIDEMNATVLGLSDIDVSTQDGANRAIQAASDALDKVLKNQSLIGAQQNRLEHARANGSNIAENTTAAESRIRDTDMAAEMVKYSRDNILAQTGQAMLAQANQTPQSVLSLFQ